MFRYVTCMGSEGSEIPFRLPPGEAKTHWSSGIEFDEGPMISLYVLFIFLQQGVGEPTSLFTGTDPSIQIKIHGNAGNVRLHANTMAEANKGLISTDYREGKGVVAFNRSRQEVDADLNRDFSLNHLAKAVRREAPHMDIAAPWGSTLIMDLNLTDLGLGQFDFSNLNVRDLKLDANFGEVYLDFPTLNQAIIRKPVQIHLTAGKLEITDLANLKAQEWNINGGVGDLKIDFGRKLLGFTALKLDLDIGNLELNIPKGTKVEITGTNRDLAPYGFLKQKDNWIVSEYHEASPLLTLHLLGPLGELEINWK